MIRFLLGATGFVLAAALVREVTAADLANGKAIFRQCAACHSLAGGEIKIGPSLAGVVGRKAGSAEGFNYSPAMKASGLIWDEATLHRYLANPRAVVPGTKMAFAGVKDPKRLDDLIAFLKETAK